MERLYTLLSGLATALPLLIAAEATQIDPALLDFDIPNDRSVPPPIAPTSNTPLNVEYLLPPASSHPSHGVRSPTLILGVIHITGDSHPYLFRGQASDSGDLQQLRSLVKCDFTFTKHQRPQQLRLQYRHIRASSINHGFGLTVTSHAMSVNALAKIAVFTQLVPNLATRTYKGNYEVAFVHLIHRADQVELPGPEGGMDWDQREIRDIHAYEDIFRQCQSIVDFYVGGTEESSSRFICGEYEMRFLRPIDQTRRKFFATGNERSGQAGTGLVIPNEGTAIEVKEWSAHVSRRLDNTGLHYIGQEKVILAGSVETISYYEYDSPATEPRKARRHCLTFSVRHPSGRQYIMQIRVRSRLHPTILAQSPVEMLVASHGGMLRDGSVAPSRYLANDICPNGAIPVTDILEICQGVEQRWKARYSSYTFGDIVPRREHALCGSIYWSLMTPVLRSFLTAPKMVITRPEQPKPKENSSKDVRYVRLRLKERFTSFKSMAFRSSRRLRKMAKEKGETRAQVTEVGT